jgi:hypothetical protein
MVGIGMITNQLHMLKSVFPIYLHKVEGLDKGILRIHWDLLNGMERWRPRRFS